MHRYMTWLHVYVYTHTHMQLGAVRLGWSTPGVFRSTGAPVRRQQHVNVQVSSFVEGRGRIRASSRSGLE